jgi:hypothetical protein
MIGGVILGWSETGQPKASESLFYALRTDY